MLAQDDRRDTTAFVLNPIETPGIRSAFAPLRDGNTLYFTGAVERPGARDPYTDLSLRTSTRCPSWRTPQLVPGINGPYHDGLAAPAPDGSILVFTRSSHKEDKANRLLTDDSDVNNTTLYYARKGLESWSACSKSASAMAPTCMRTPHGAPMVPACTSRVTCPEATVAWTSGTSGAMARPGNIRPSTWAPW